MKHPKIRAQQRYIPPMVDQLLDLYGQKEHARHWGVILHFNKSASGT